MTLETHQGTTVMKNNNSFKFISFEHSSPIQVNVTHDISDLSFLDITGFLKSARQ